MNNPCFQYSLKNDVLVLKAPDFVYSESSEPVLTLSKTKRRKAEERIGVYKDELLARVALLPDVQIC